MNDAEIVRWLRREAQFQRCANPVAKKGEAASEEKCREKAEMLDLAADALKSNVQD